MQRNNVRILFLMLVILNVSTGCQKKDTATNWVSPAEQQTKAKQAIQSNPHIPSKVKEAILAANAQSANRKPELSASDPTRKTPKK